MPSRLVAEALKAPPGAHAAILQGKWLERGAPAGLVAMNPASVFEGSGDALAELPRWISWHADRHPAGAAIGYFSYEAARFFERLPLTANTSLPDVWFAYYPCVERLPRLEPEPADTELSSPPEIRSNFDKHAYAEAVETIRDYIAAGDIYQANLTCEFRAQLAGIPPERIYSRLARLEPSFGAFLKGPDQTLISNSPERFFRVLGDRILASPIKGTIARPGNPALDAECVSTLLASGKDLAENVMIVDLLRNDLGRICCYETIEAGIFDVQTLPHLFHLVSHVEGTLRPGTGLLEILRALFPCGSVTGAPKIRAMEILAEIENTPRGVSMGAIGIIRGRPGSAECEMDFSVAIRTMTIEDAAATFHVGGGIVYDSRPEPERKEMMLKARPLLEALGVPTASEPGILQACAVER
jgi:para-aminobenzoate synthetase component 1